MKVQIEMSTKEAEQVLDIISRGGSGLFALRKRNLDALTRAMDEEARRVLKEKVK